MKKILMGLLAVSTLSFSEIDMTSPATGTNVFKIAEIGKIKMTAKVRSNVTPVKYVVFANSNDAFAGAETELTLPDIFLSQSSQQNVIDGTPSKIYVRKVNGNNDDIEPLSAESVQFTINFDSTYTGIATNKVSKGGKVAVVPTALMTNTELTDIVGASGYTVNDKGEVVKDGKFYRTPNNVEFYSNTQGVLEVKMSTNTQFGTDAMEPGDITALEALFSTKKPFNSLTISAYVM